MSKAKETKAERGRPGGATAGNREDPRTRDEEKRPERVPMYEQRNRMGVPPRQGYERRWVNILPGNVDSHLLAGWTVAKDNLPVGDPSIKNHNVSLGEGAYTHVGRAGTEQNVWAVLMEIPTEIYQQDKQREWKEKVDDREAAIFRTLTSGDPRNPHADELPGGTYGDTKVDDQVVKHKGSVGKRYG